MVLEEVVHWDDGSRHDRQHAQAGSLSGDSERSRVERRVSNLKVDGAVGELLSAGFGACERDGYARVNVEGVCKGVMDGGLHSRTAANDAKSIHIHWPG